MTTQLNRRSGHLEEIVHDHTPVYSPFTFNSIPTTDDKTSQLSGASFHDGNLDFAKVRMQDSHGLETHQYVPLKNLSAISGVFRRVLSRPSEPANEQKTIDWMAFNHTSVQYVLEQINNFSIIEQPNKTLLKDMEESEVLPLLGGVWRIARKYRMETLNDQCEARLFELLPKFNEEMLRKWCNFCFSSDKTALAQAWVSAFVELCKNTPTEWDRIQFIMEIPTWTLKNEDPSLSLVKAILPHIPRKLIEARADLNRTAHMLLDIRKWDLTLLDLATQNQVLDYLKELRSNGISIFLMLEALKTDRTSNHALQLLNQAIQQDPSYSFPYAYLAKTLFTQGRSQEALHLLNALLIIEPNHGEALFLRSQIYAYLQQASFAWRDLDQVVALAPYFITSMSQPETAKPSLISHAQDLAKDKTKRHLAIAYLNCILKDISAEHTGISQQDQQALLLRAETFCRVARYKEAMIDLTLLLQVNSNHLKGHLLMGRCHEVLGNHEMALHSFFQIVDLIQTQKFNPISAQEYFNICAQTYYSMGCIYQLKGDEKKKTEVWGLIPPNHALHKKAFPAPHTNPLTGILQVMEPPIDPSQTAVQYLD